MSSPLDWTYSPRPRVRKYFQEIYCTACVLLLPALTSACLQLPSVQTHADEAKLVQVLEAFDHVRLRDGTLGLGRNLLGKLQGARRALRAALEYLEPSTNQVNFCN